MPTVPISHAKPEVLSSAARQAQPLETRENISQFQLRQQLAEAVRAETAKKGTVTTHFLDQFAATHLSSQDENDAAVLITKRCVMRPKQRKNKTTPPNSKMGCVGKAAGSRK